MSHAAFGNPHRLLRRGARPTISYLNRKLSRASWLIEVQPINFVPFSKRYLVACRSVNVVKNWTRQPLHCQLAEIMEIIAIA